MGSSLDCGFGGVGFWWFRKRGVGVRSWGDRLGTSYEGDNSQWVDSPVGQKRDETISISDTARSWWRYDSAYAMAGKSVDGQRAHIFADWRTAGDPPHTDNWGPIPSSANPNWRADAVSFKAESYPGVTHNVGFELVQYANFNEGGLSRGDDKAMAQGSTIWGSLHAGDGGQWYEVEMESGQTLEIRGYVRPHSFNLGTAFGVTAVDTANGEHMVVNLSAYKKEAFTSTYRNDGPAGTIAFHVESAAWKVQDFGIRFGKNSPCRAAWTCHDACPMDDSPSPNGPQRGDPVNVGSGREFYEPGPDLAVYNPLGTTVNWGAQWNSYLVARGYASPGFSPGWAHGYDLFLEAVDPQNPNSDLIFFSPNGSAETLTPDNQSTENTVALTVADGAPYQARGVRATDTTTHL